MASRKALWLALLLFACSALFQTAEAQSGGQPPPARPVQGQSPEDIKSQILASESETLTKWDQTLSKIEAELNDANLDHNERNTRRLTLVALARNAEQAAQRYGQRQAEAQRLLDALGPTPEEGQPAEAPEVQAERAKLEQDFVAISALKGRADLVMAKANLLLRQLDEVRIRAFAQELLQRGSSLLQASTWQNLPSSYEALKASIGARLTPRNQPVEADQTRRILLGVAALVVALAGVPVSRRLGALLDRRRKDQDGPIAYHRRVGAAMIEIALRFFLPSFAFISILLLTLAIAADSDWSPVIEPAAIALTSGILFAFLLAALGHANLAPRLPNWGVIRLSPRSGQALYRRWLVACGFLGIVLTLRMIARDLQPGQVLESVSNAVEVLVGSLILLSLLPARLWQPVEAKEGSEAEEVAEDDEASALTAAVARLGEARWLRFFSLITALVSMVAAVLGYVTLSDYIALMFITLVAAGFHLLVLRGAIRDWLHVYLVRQQKRRGAWLRLFIKTERGTSFFELFVFIVLDVILLLAALFIVLPTAGMAEDELQVWIYNTLKGFTLAGVTIKPINILLAILVFLFILGFTRFVQRRMRRGVLAAISPENSVQQSITTGIGYIGVIGAILMGINVMGFDLTNLALIAGALSVGIGFGLQNIVSNFVSGLILLIERPIKVGDWVVVGGNEGVVKRISVRATELETWQRSSVLIPNSDLVSTAVTNWTHKNKLGRVDVAVRVPFASDPKQVHDLLLEAAGDCHKILAHPAPYVYFKAFSPDGMDFDIRVYVQDIYMLVIEVANELRMAVVKRFAEAGIEMALPQRVVHFPPAKGGDAESLKVAPSLPPESEAGSEAETPQKR